MGGGAEPVGTVVVELALIIEQHHNSLETAYDGGGNSDTAYHLPIFLPPFASNQFEADLSTARG